MSYLQDKKIKRKKILSIALLIFTLFILFHFRLSIFNSLAYVSHKLFRPILVAGNKLGEKFSNINSFFAFKSSLYKENEDLKSQLNENKATMSNYNSILAENINLKEILGRKISKTAMVLASVLSKPSQSFYNILIVDAGTEQKIKVGNIVFALGNVPIGRIAETYPNSSKVVLFSNAGEKTQVIIGDKNIFMEIIGRGGGNFEMILPRDFKLTKGDQVILPGITSYVLGVVETIISDPRDSFQKALLVSPVNIQELKFVEVEK